MRSRSVQGENPDPRKFFPTTNRPTPRSGRPSADPQESGRQAIAKRKRISGCPGAARQTRASRAVARACGGGADSAKIPAWRIRSFPYLRKEISRPRKLSVFQDIRKTARVPARFSEDFPPLGTERRDPRHVAGGGGQRGVAINSQDGFRQRKPDRMPRRKRRRPSGRPERWLALSGARRPTAATALTALTSAQPRKTKFARTRVSHAGSRLRL